MPIDSGQKRIYYNNFAEHLQNAYNPNMLYPGLPNGWTDAQWRALIDMIAGFGFNAFEFWLLPRLFCRQGLQEPYGQAFIRQMRTIIAYANERGVTPIMLCSLATVGDKWHTLCPNLADEWEEIQYLWNAWLEQLPELGGIAIFPGDPGACSRNGCTAETFIDRALDIAALAHTKLPRAEVELHTWGPPFFGWGNLQGPPGWQGEFIASYQHSAWSFDRDRADRSMTHLLKRLASAPPRTTVAINLGFNGDGVPGGEQDAVQWAREIARTHPIRTWDFSLTEGENAIVPHYRLERLFAQRRREREAAPYSGGICFTMTPLLNQLSLYAAAQSFLRPDADPHAVGREFCTALFGEQGAGLVDYLPLFEIVPDWGNHARPELSRAELHRGFRELSELLADLAGQERGEMALHPTPAEYREELLWHARLLADLSAPAPDYDGAATRYWQRIYAIYDHLPEHVDPRPHQATRNLIDTFREISNAAVAL